MMSNTYLQAWRLFVTVKKRTKIWQDYYKHMRLGYLQLKANEWKHEMLISIMTNKVWFLQREYLDLDVTE